MLATARIPNDREHKRKQWWDFDHYVGGGHRQLRRNHLIWVGVAFAAAIVFWSSPRTRWYALCAAGFGCVSFAHGIWRERHFLNQFLDQSQPRTETRVHFEEDRVRCSEDGQEESHNWSAFDRGLLADHGLFIFLAGSEDAYMYVPYAALDPPSSRYEIIHKVRKTDAPVST